MVSLHSNRNSNAVTYRGHKSLTYSVEGRLVRREGLDGTCVHKHAKEHLMLFLTCHPLFITRGLSLTSNSPTDKVSWLSSPIEQSVSTKASS